MQMSHSSQWQRSSFFTTSMPLLARQGRHSSPSSSGLGAEMPGLIKPVASQTVSRKMMTTVRMRKKVCVSSALLSLKSSRMVKKLMRRKLTAKTRSEWRKAYSWARGSGRDRPCGSQSSPACSSPAGFSCRFRGTSGGTIPASCCAAPIRCSSAAFCLNNIYNPPSQFPPTAQRCPNRPAAEAGIARRSLLSFALSYFNSCHLYLFYWLDFMNLSITGKKMNTPVATKKNAEIASPAKQAKVLPQKPALQVKPKSTVVQAHKPVQPKKQEALKVEVKKEAKKEEQTVSKQETAPKTEVKAETEAKIQTAVQDQKEQVLGSVIVRYNHYKESFQTINGILSFLPIEEKYSFGSVFRGNYKPVLKPFRANDEICPETAGTAIDFTWKVEADKQYKLQIWEDEQQELKVEKRAYKAPQNDGALLKKNARFEQLTEAMKKMDPKELGGEKHRQMLEQRDLEDVLFS